MPGTDIAPLQYKSVCWMFDYAWCKLLMVFISNMIFNHLKAYLMQSNYTSYAL